MNWSLQDAKNRFSEVVKRARSEGPQTVTLWGEPAAVVPSATDYDALARNRPRWWMIFFPAPTGMTGSRMPSAPGPSRRAATSRFKMYLVDTNVVSEARRVSRQALTRLRSVRPDAVYLSALTPSEIMRGVALRQRTDRPTAQRLGD